MDGSFSVASLALFSMVFAITNLLAGAVSKADSAQKASSHDLPPAA